MAIRAELEVGGNIEVLGFSPRREEARETRLMLDLKRGEEREATTRLRFFRSPLFFSFFFFINSF